MILQLDEIIDEFAPVFKDDYFVSNFMADLIKIPELFQI